MGQISLSYRHVRKLVEDLYKSGLASHTSSLNPGQSHEFNEPKRGASRLNQPALRDSHEGVANSSASSLFSDLGRAYVYAPEYEELISALASLTTDVDACLSGIVEDVGMRIARVCVVEIHAMRLEGNYVAIDPVDQYREFVESLRNDSARVRLHNIYPGLMTAVAGKVRGVLELCIAVARTYKRDLPKIKSSYEEWGCQAPAELINSVKLVGDLHPGFRGTVRINTSNNTTLYYKARSSVTEQFFHNIFEKFNAVFKAKLSIPGFIVGNEYFWQQAVKNSSAKVSSSATVSDINYNLGALTVLAHATGLHDLHFENIIADENGVVVIDSECGPRRDFNLVASVREGSISDIGILPMLISVREGNTKVCWGVMDGPPVAAPMALHIPTGGGTSNVRLVEEELGGAQTKTVPRIRLDEHWFHRGALEASAFVTQESADQWNLAISGVESDARFLVRSTREYAEVLRRTCYPQFSMSKAARREHIEQCLTQMNIHIPKGLVLQEVEQLTQEIIPAFSYREVSPYFVTTRERLATTQLQAESLHERLDQISDTAAFARYVTHVARQQYFLCYDSQTFVVRSDTRKLAPEYSDPISRGLSALRLFSIPTLSEPMWSNVVEIGGAASSRAEVFEDLYNGSVGSALALVFLGADIDYSDKCIPTINSTLSGIFERLKKGRLPVGTGVFNGLAGWLYFALCTRSVFPALRSRAEDALGLVLDALERRVHKDDADSFDVISGDAGVLILLARLSQAMPQHRGQCVELVRVLDRRLRRRSIRVGPGRVAWLSPDGVWLGGFSHGVAGVAYAASLWRDEGMGDLADLAWRTQLDLFDRDSGTWIDRRSSRDSPEEAVQMEAWCHGFDGVLLASAFGDNLDLPFDDGFHDAISSWAGRPAVKARGICHGPSSRLEILNLLSCHSSKFETGPWASSRRHFMEAGSRLREELEQQVGDFTAVEGIAEINCGLMLGLSGDLLPLRVGKSGFGIGDSSPLLVGLPEFRTS